MLLYGLTDCGMIRTQNEDYYAAAAWQGREGHYLCVVCDGMGGAKGGAYASRTAADAFVRAAQAEKGTVEKCLRRALKAANTAVYEKARADKEQYGGMGTTLVAVMANEDTLCVMHVGDSRAYLLHGGTLFRLTEDHSLVQSLVAEGKLRPEEAARSPYKNVITRAVGVKDKAEGEIGAFIWTEGDRLLLCTDGLSGPVSEDEIWDILSEDKDISHVTHELIAAALAHGGDDNITALVIENKKETFGND